jgi:hypothetical protein
MMSELLPQVLRIRFEPKTKRHFSTNISRACRHRHHIVTTGLAKDLILSEPVLSAER